MSRLIRILGVSALALFCLQTFSDNKADVDLWGNVGFVKALPWSPDFRQTNTFSFTEPEHRWINHEWLSEYLFHRVFAVSGNPGLLALKLILGFALVALLVRELRATCASPPILFLYLLLTVSTLGYGYSTRPHHFTYLMLALFLTVLKRHERGRSAGIWFIPFLGLLWANLHGAFFIGILLLVLYTAADGLEAARPRSPEPRPRGYHVQLAAALAGFALLSLANPYGADLWTMIAQSAVTFRPYLSEWAPFNPLTDWADHTDFLALVFVSLLSVFLSPRPRKTAWLLLLAVAFAAALLMRRNIPLFAIVACFVVPEHLLAIAEQPVKKIVAALPPVILAFFLAAFLPLALWGTLVRHKTHPLQIEVPPNHFPVHVVRFVQDHRIRGNALVHFDWAEYWIWKCPESPVFLDGRFTDAYSPQTINDYFRFLALGDGWNRAVTNYPVDILLIHKRTPIFKVMPSLGAKWTSAREARNWHLPPGASFLHEEWQPVCEDDISCLLLKKSVHRDTLQRLPPPACLKNDRVTFFP